MFYLGMTPREAEALRWACAAGALATQAAGGTGGQPTRAELLEALSVEVDR